MPFTQEEDKKKKKIITMDFVPVKAVEFTPIKEAQEEERKKIITNEFVPIREVEEELTSVKKVEEFTPIKRVLTEELTEVKEFIPLEKEKGKIVTDFIPVKAVEEVPKVDKFIPTGEVGEIPTYREWTGLEKTIAPIRSFEAGMLGAGARTAGALDKASTALAKIISKVTKIPEEKLRGGVFKILEKDLDYYSERAREMGVEGLVGEVAEGLGGASWDIPAIMTFGKFGLPIHGALFGAAESGLEGAVKGAITGAFTHKMLGAIGILPSKARLPAFAGFGFAMTEGGVEERTAGSLTWAVLGLTGGAKKVTVREFMDNYPVVKQKIDSMKAGRILKGLDPTITRQDVAKLGGSVAALDEVYREMYHEEIRQTLDQHKIFVKQVIMGEMSLEQAQFAEKLDKKIDEANKAGKRLGKKRLYNVMELTALESDVSLKEVLQNADVISESLVRTKLSLSDMIKENKYLFRQLDRVEDSQLRPPSADAKAIADTQEMIDGIPLENRPYSLPLPEGRKLKIVNMGREGSMPIYSHEVAVLFKNLEPKELRLEKKLLRKKGAGWFKNFIYTIEEYPELKKLLYDPIKLAENVTARGDIITNERVKAWTEALKRSTKAPREEWTLGEETVKDSIKRLGVYAISQQKGGVGNLKQMGIEPIYELNNPTEIKIYNTVRQDLESIYDQINQTRKLIGLDPMPKVENYFTFFRNLEVLKEEGYNPIYEPDGEFLHQKLNAVPFEFAKGRGKAILPVDLRFFDVYKLYRGKAMKFISKSPIIAKGRNLISDYEFEIELPDGTMETNVLGLRHTHPVLHSVIDKWLDHQIGATTKATGVEGKFGTRLAGKLNRNVAMWVLSWNVRSALIQPTALRLAYMEIGAKWLGKGATSFLNEGKRNFAERESNVLLSRMFDIHAEEIFGMGVEREVSKVKSAYVRGKAKFGKTGIKPLQFLDLISAKIAWLGAFEKAVAPKAKGGFQMDKAKARIYADDTVTKTQASAQPSDVAPIQRTPWGKTLTLFQTFVINEWNYLYKNVGGWGERVATPKMSIGKRAVQVGRLVFATALINALFEGVFHVQSPYPSPEWELIEGLKEDRGTRKIITSMVRELGEQLPVVGGTIRWSSSYRTNFPAIPQLGIDAAIFLNKIGETDISKINKNDVEMVGKILGIPGGGQVMKYLRRRKKGMSHIEAMMGVQSKYGK